MLGIIFNAAIVVILVLGASMLMVKALIFLGVGAVTIKCGVQKQEGKILKLLKGIGYIVLGIAILLAIMMFFNL